MSIILSCLRNAFRFSATAAFAISLLLGGIVQPLPARAAQTENWQCTPELEAPLPVILSAGTPAGQRTDRRTVALNCTFDAPSPGNALISLCLSAPLGSNPDGVLRQARSVIGNSLVHYALTAEPGNVPNVEPQIFDAITPTLKPLYSVTIQSGGPGRQAFRHQFKLVTEFEGLTRRGLDAGGYSDILSGFVASVHQGATCGPVLWGPSTGALGELANLTITASLAPQCDFVVNKALDFGTATLSVGGSKADGLITLTCLTNLPNITISMGPGNNPVTDGGPVIRQMRRSDGAATIPYLILKPDGTEWSQTGSIIPGTPLDLPGVDGMSVPISGLIPQGTKFPLAGDYSDSVIVYLGF